MHSSLFYYGSHSLSAARHRESLIVDFKPVTSTNLPALSETDEAPKFELVYDIALAGDKQVDSSRFQG